MGPELPRLRMQRRPELVPVAEGVDLRPVAVAADERVVVRDAAVVQQADDLADGVPWILRPRAAGGRAERPAHGHEQAAVGGEDDARGGGAPDPVRLKEIADVDQPVVGQPSPRQGHARALAGRLRVGQVHQPVLREPRMQGHVHEAGQPLRMHGRHSAHRGGVEHPVADEAQPPRPLGHQQAAVGQERQPPRMLEPAGHHHHPDLRLLGRREDPRLVGQGHRGQSRQLCGGIHRHRQDAPARQGQIHYRSAA